LLSCLANRSLTGHGPGVPSRPICSGQVPAPSRN